MNGLNLCVLIGHAKNAPERRGTTEAPTAVFQLVTRRTYIDKRTMQTKDIPATHQVVVFREWVDYVLENIRKESIVYVVGLMQYHATEDGKLLSQVKANIIEVIH